MSAFQPPSARDVDIWVRTVWGEARGEPELGQLAVAWVIRTRAELAALWMSRHGHAHPLFGDGSAAAACQAPWQFSCWLEADPNREKLLALPSGDRSYRALEALVRSVASSALPNPAPGATHYEAIGIGADWAQGRAPIATIGHHDFYVIP